MENLAIKTQNKMTYKNSEKIDELKTEFEKLQQSEDCKFAPDIDGFVDFLAEKIIELEGEVSFGAEIVAEVRRRREVSGWDSYQEFKRERNKERELERRREEGS